MAIQKVNLAQAFATFSEHWSPRIAGEINETHVKLVKFEGKFDWHHHAHEDEMFLVVAGTMRMWLHSGNIDVHPGEFIVIPHGIEHCPEALDTECHVVLLEPKTTVNTGSAVTEKTLTVLKTL
jgi:mannose-6-phosphate isomerase-like protein (cupin superfamily)